MPDVLETSGFRATIEISGLRGLFTVQMIPAQPTENGSAIVTVAFYNGATATTPTTATWTLSKGDGTIVNSREDVSLTPAASISWALSAADLALESNYESRSRYITVEGTWTHATLGVLPYRFQWVFEIQDLV